MRGWLRNTLINSVAIYLVVQAGAGLKFSGSLLDLFWAGLVFTLLNWLAKPVIKLILLPINLLTLGLLSWVSQVLVLVITVMFLPQLKVVSFVIPAVSQNGFSLPSFSVSLVLSYILSSLLLSLVHKLLEWSLWQD